MRTPRTANKGGGSAARSLIEAGAARNSDATGMSMWQAALVLAVLSFAATAIVFVLMPFAFTVGRDLAAAIQAAAAALPEYGSALAPHLVGGLALVGAILIATLGVIVVDRRIRQALDFQLRDNLAPFALFATAATVPAIVMVVISAATGETQAAGVLILAIPLFGVLAMIACYIGTYRGVSPREQAAATARAANAAREALTRLQTARPSGGLPAPVKLRGRITLAATAFGATASTPAWFFIPLGAPALGYSGHLLTTLLCVVVSVGSVHLTVGIYQASLAVPSKAAIVTAWAVWLSTHIGFVAPLLTLFLYASMPTAISAFGAVLVVTLAATEAGLKLPTRLNGLSIARMSLSLVAADLELIARRGASGGSGAFRSPRPGEGRSLRATGIALGARGATIAAALRQRR